MAGPARSGRSSPRRGSLRVVRRAPIRAAPALSTARRRSGRTTSDHRFLRATGTRSPTRPLRLLRGGPGLSRGRVRWALALLVDIARRLERFALRGAARVVAVNDEVARDVERFGVPAHRVDVVGNGVDTDVFRLEGPVSRPPGVAASASCFVYAGSMNTLHGAGIFVEAFERVVAVRPDTVLVMVGRGEEVEALRERGRLLPPGSFVLMDSVSGAEAAALLRGARAGLASIRPGSGYEFALATKAVAAAATGSPVVFAGGHDGRPAPRR
ncbi:glycosyltransferase [Oerskovia sp. M15]